MNTASHCLGPDEAQGLIERVALSVLRKVVEPNGVCGCARCTNHLVDRVSLLAIQVVDNTESLDAWVSERGRNEVFDDIHEVVKLEALHWRQLTMLPYFGKVPKRRRPGRLQLDSRGLGIMPMGLRPKAMLH